MLFTPVNKHCRTIQHDLCGLTSTEQNKINISTDCKTYIDEIYKIKEFLYSIKQYETNSSAEVTFLQGD